MILTPPGTPVLLHVCCAPCSGAIIEALCGQGLRPTVFWSNSNIFSAEENARRLAVLQPYADSFGVPVVVDEYDHAAWLAFVRQQLALESCTSRQKTPKMSATPDSEEGLPTKTAKNDGMSGPERGPRCLMCFRYRLLRAARYAAANDFGCLTTSLASSRWKTLEQVDDAGRWAVAEANAEAACRSAKAGSGGPVLKWWPQNWRKGGLQPRRDAIIREQNFYNQTFCGCEYSKPSTI